MLRVNYFRAMAGVPSGVTLNSVYNGKDQQAALMMSANNALSHNPPSSWLYYTADGAEAAGNSNLSLGTSGPDAVAGYIEDAGSNNTAVGHRRWVLYPQTQEMGTGDVPQSGGYSPANALWVFDDHYSDPRPATRDGFVAWPPKGYVPYPVVWARWSLSYPGANFNSATVTMQQGATNIPVTIQPIATGYGENTIVWMPNSMSDGDSWPKPGSDTTHTITISNVTGAGVPGSFNYTVTLFDPQQTGADTVLPVLSGSTNVVAATTHPYTFNSVPTATGYQWAVSQRTPFTLVEGAENGLANMVASVPDGYNPIVSDIKAAGSYSFHLTHPGFDDQSLTLTRVIVPGATSQLQFQSRLTYATSTQVVRAQISTDGNSWTDIYTQAGSGGSGEGSFTLRTVSLAAYAGRDVTLRFTYDYTGGSAYTQSGSGFGWYLDDITVTNAEELTNTTATSIGTTAFDYTPQTAGSYALRVRAQVYGAYYLDWGPILPVTVTAPNWLADELRAGPDGNLRLLWRHQTSGAPDGQLSLWTLNNSAVYQGSTVTGPYAGWTADDSFVVGTDSKPHLLWRHTGGAVSMWTFSTSGSYEAAASFGPYAGWTGAELSAGTVGQVHLMWQNTNGSMSFWTLGSAGNFLGASSFGPYSGWTCADKVAVGPDSKPHPLWRRTDGAVSVWTLGTGGAYETASGYGPFTGWDTSVFDLQVGADNQIRLPWLSTANQISYWTLNGTGGFVSAFTFGPIGGWTPRQTLVRPDNKSVLLWRNTSGAWSVWRLSNSGSAETSIILGPFSGWDIAGAVVDSGNNLFLLWTKTTGEISIWKYNGNLTFVTAANYGPY